MKVTGSYKPTKWDEEDVHEIAENKKITKASVEFTVTGETEGIASLEYLMYYNYSDPNDQHKSDARYIGFVPFDGMLCGKVGTFAMADRGAFSKGEATSSLTIIEGSGAHELTGITGGGKYSANKDGAVMEITFEVEKS